MFEHGRANRPRGAASPALLLAGLIATAPAGAELSDPLAPPTPDVDAVEPAEPGPADYHLGSTLIAGDRRVAVINGRIVGPGETVDGAEVIAVERNRVRLRRDGEEFTIASERPSIRSRSAEDEQP